MLAYYPISSQELNDKFYSAYEHIVSLIGYETSGVLTHTGLYDRINSSGEAFVISPSGLPSHTYHNMNKMLKFDYIYRTHYNINKYNYENK